MSFGTFLCSDVVDYADCGFDGGGSQPNGVPSQNTTHTSVTPIPPDHASKNKYSAPQTKPLAVQHKAVVDLESVKVVPSEKKLSVVIGTAPLVDRASDAVSVASSSRASNSRPLEREAVSTVDNAEPLGSGTRMAQVLSTQFQQTVLRLVPVRELTSPSFPFGLTSAYWFTAHERVCEHLTERDVQFGSGRRLHH